jgi:hypothetical protein
MNDSMTNKMKNNASLSSLKEENDHKNYKNYKNYKVKEMSRGIRNFGDGDS